jgi:hypothetical protein
MRGAAYKLARLKAAARQLHGQIALPQVDAVSPYGSSHIGAVVDNEKPAGTPHLLRYLAAGFVELAGRGVLVAILNQPHARREQNLANFCQRTVPGLCGVEDGIEARK